MEQQLSEYKNLTSYSPISHKWQLHLYLHIPMSPFLMIFLPNHGTNASNLQLQLFENQVQNLIVIQIILHVKQG
jgi:hypothetical protein